jgi:predicted phosphoribosyltransferase
MFRDRKDGGEQLTKALKKYKNSNVLVVGILAHLFTQEIS